MRIILTSLAAALVLAASSAVAGADCFSGHQQVMKSTAPEETVAMSTNDDQVAVEVKVAEVKTACADGDANCQPKSAEAE